MKSFFINYIKGIKHLQSILILTSIGIFLLALPMVFAFNPDFLPKNIKTTLYLISFAAVSFVMAIQPLADIFPKIKWIRPLVVLRKGFGILSASIIISFILFKIITMGPKFLINFLLLDYWKFSNYSFFAHLGDVTAVILLATSNVFSKKILGKNWKRIQKLSYVYFYSGGIYEYFVFQDMFAAYAMLIVSFLVSLAFFINFFRKHRLTK